MRIGLLDVDGHHFPNLALMKISAYHKQLGDVVEWANPFDRYDRLYKSKVFTFTPDDLTPYDCEVVKGGTGYDMTSQLPTEIDMMQPDYSIYPYIDNRTAYGFLTRGCPNKCKWCIVPLKEGAVKPYMDIEEISMGGVKNNLILMDNNILATDYGLSQIEQIVAKGYRVDFNQGLDARLITDDIAKLLAKVRWNPYIRLACDKFGQVEHILKAHDMLAKYGFNKRIFCYFLIDDWDDAMKRLSVMKPFEWFHPFGQPRRDFNNPNQIIPQWQKDLAKWMDKKMLYKTTPLAEFEPRKGFKFKEYFNQFTI